MYVFMVDLMADCIIGSCDYCHVPVGFSSFFVSIESVWEMTTVVDKIAYHSCTVCPVLKLCNKDTVHSVTANTLKLFVRGKNTANSTAMVATMARPTKN